MPTRISTTSRRARRRLRLRIRGRRAFTLIELLVVAAIVILLLGLLIVAVNIATKASQKARTQALLNSIKQGLIRFNEAFGYYAPMLGPNGGGLRDMFLPPDMSVAPTAYSFYKQDWFSTCTTADYLIGYGSHREDGYGRVPNVGSGIGWHNEVPATGIRNPGDDGYWGAAANGGGLLIQRMQYGQAGWGSDVAPYPWDQGKVFGPYIELKDERLLAGINYSSGGTLEVYAPGDTLPTGLTWDTIPKAIVDYWGKHIRYYRKPYQMGFIKHSYRSGTDINRDNVVHANDRVPTL